jgi:hypothetical protein
VAPRASSVRFPQASNFILKRSHWHSSTHSAILLSQLSQRFLPSDVRVFPHPSVSNITTFHGGGWHFTNFGGVDMITQVEQCFKNALCRVDYGFFCCRLQCHALANSKLYILNSASIAENEHVQPHGVQGVFCFNLVHTSTPNGSNSGYLQGRS